MCNMVVDAFSILAIDGDTMSAQRLRHDPNILSTQAFDISHPLASHYHRLFSM